MYDFVLVCFDFVLLQEELARMNNHPSSGRRGLTRQREHDVRLYCAFVLCKGVYVLG